MAVDPTTATGVTGSSSAGRQRMVESYDTFMKLLTAQVQNQDPLKPMDSTQFTQQLVQMTGVEQQLLTNDLLDKLITNTSSGIQTSVSLLGREVRAVQDSAKLMNGKAEWSYQLDRDATDVKLEVLDKNGKTVKTFKPEDNKAGDHVLSWDGKGYDGFQLPNGDTYTLRITATDSTGTAVPASNYIKGIVTGVQQVDGKTLLTINGVQVGWEKVTSIAEAAKPPVDDGSNDDTPEGEQPPAEQAA